MVTEGDIKYEQAKVQIIRVGAMLWIIYSYSSFMSKGQGTVFAY